MSTNIKRDWVDEETFFAADRYAQKYGERAYIIEKKWSEGSSPIILIKYEFRKPTPQ